MSLDARLEMPAGLVVVGPAGHGNGGTFGPCAEGYLFRDSLRENPLAAQETRRPQLEEWEHVGDPPCGRVYEAPAAVARTPTLWSRRVCLPPTPPS